ncbi:hypothetical protein BDY24DRAFT_243079 [Mrakia frigida]|uniref:J domain-containing protein n=1 Tax=Mrakia frigida TaxID=29902 RepID=UPI003FCC0A51
MNAIASSSRSSTLLCSTLLSSSSSSSSTLSSSSNRTFSSSSRWAAASASDNHYRTLDIDRGASRKQIKERFYDLSKKYHPDLTPGDKVAKAKYLSISEAYDTLGNESKRSLYDRTLSPVPRATHTSTHYTRTGRPSTWVHPSTRLPPRPRSTMLHHQQHSQRPSPTSNAASQPFPLNGSRPTLGSQMPRSNNPTGASFQSPFSPYLNPDTLQSRYNPVTGKPDPLLHHPLSSTGGPGTSAFASFAANGFGFGPRNQPPTPPPHHNHQPSSSSPSSSSSSDPSTTPGPGSFGFGPGNFGTLAGSASVGVGGGGTRRSRSILDPERSRSVHGSGTSESTRGGFLDGSGEFVDVWSVVCWRGGGVGVGLGEGGGGGLGWTDEREDERFLFYVVWRERKRERERERGSRDLAAKRRGRREVR